MDELTAGKLTVQRSRFYAHLYRIETPDEVSAILERHRTTYRKACHHCHALRIGTDEAIEEAWNDDGEVGRPGRVLLDLLQRYKLHRNALVVSRVYGGVNLGVGNVARAFRRAGEGAIQHYLDG